MNTIKKFVKNRQYYKFCFYGFFKNLKFFEPFIMLYFIDKGISFLQIGTLYAIREIAINLLEVPTGFFADVLGRRRTMMAAFMAYIVSFVVFYFSNDFVWLAAGMVLFSVGEASRTGTHKAMIFDYLKLNRWDTDKTVYYGHTRSWSQIGAAVSSILAALIVVISGNYGMVFLFSAIPYLIDMALVWSYPKILDGPIMALDKVKPAEKIKQYYKSSLLGFKNIHIWKTFSNLSVFHGYFRGVKDYLQPIILIAIGSLAVTSEASDKQSAITVGAVYFVIYLISAAVSRYSYLVNTWFKSAERALNYTLIFGVGFGLISGLLLVFDSAVFSVLLFVGIYIIQNLRKTLGTSYLAEIVDNDVLATGLSVESLFDSFFAALFAMFIGLMADKFSIGAGLLVLGGALFITSFFLKLKQTKSV